jgi:hypothetical protein
MGFEILGVHITIIRYPTPPSSTGPSLDDISEEESNSRSSSPEGSTVSTKGFPEVDGCKVILGGKTAGRRCEWKEVRAGYFWSYYYAAVGP